jgi:hypothetical protein
MAADTWVVQIEMVGIDGPASITAIDGYGTIEPTGSAKRAIVGAEVIDVGCSVVLAPSSKVTLRFSDGTTETLEASSEDGAHFRFESRAQLERPVENFHEEQLRGYLGLKEKIESGLVDASALSMMPVFGSRISLQEALALTDAGAATAMPRATSVGLDVVPLRAHDALIIVAAAQWTIDTCIEVIRALRRPISPTAVSPEDLRLLRARVYGT